MAPGTIRRSGWTFIFLAIWMSSGTRMVVVALFDVINSVMKPLMTQTVGAMAKYGVCPRKSSVLAKTSATPLVLTPSAIARPAPSNKTIFHGSFLHLFQSISFSPCCFLFGIMNSKVAIITCSFVIIIIIIYIRRHECLLIHSFTYANCSITNTVIKQASPSRYVVSYASGHP
ncbi:hypothetical protein HanRHA438_Chr05g0202671 [Helianthus annuus]|uniref:Uncharacterized protein n=1 Tax=Helianthus annuus TaxID=4232 RepID=A0A9K3NLH2_HELAN|nr:hypothetical protein HanXRQr2_Chr05g0192911 [Helianthus annuus]KAJ0575012.1 hypothetical protein HanIR_Chr05g0208091 [Helianthus annuus]KAJ0917134.1 hypothetical protein HanRHA438_Chr05g0202671 [Helianthus annuus]